MEKRFSQVKGQRPLGAGNAAAMAFALALLMQAGCSSAAVSAPASSSASAASAASVAAGSSAAGDMTSASSAAGSAAGAASSAPASSSGSATQREQGQTGETPAQASKDGAPGWRRIELSEFGLRASFNEYLSRFAMTNKLEDCPCLPQEYLPGLTRTPTDYSAEELPQDYLAMFAAQYCGIFKYGDIEEADDWGVGPGGSATQGCNMRVDLTSAGFATGMYFGGSIVPKNADGEGWHTTDDYLYWGITAPPGQSGPYIALIDGVEEIDLSYDKGSEEPRKHIYRLSFVAARARDRYELFGFDCPLYQCDPSAIGEIAPGAAVTRGSAVVLTKPMSQFEYQLLAWDIE